VGSSAGIKLWKLEEPDEIRNYKDSIWWRVGLMCCLQFDRGGKLVQKSSNLDNWKRQQSEILGRWGPIAGKIS